MKQEIGLKIVITNEIKYENNNFIKSEINSKKCYTKMAILDCLAKRSVITVVADSLAVAIEKILFQLDALSKEKREFFLGQISHVLTEVECKINIQSYVVDDAVLRPLIREDKLYRIEGYSNRIKKKKHEEI